MRKAAFRNLGCKVNEYEMEYMQQKMAEAGFEIVPFDAKADVYIVNTCTVTNIADRKSRQMLHQAKKRNPGAVVVAAGCYVQTDPDGASKDSAVDLCIGNNRKADLAAIITEYLDAKEHTKAVPLYMEDLSEDCAYEEMFVPETAEHTRAYIKIEDGCNQFCSYCAIPLARGRVRSRSLESIRKEAEKLAENGYREVVLTGIHLSSYGLDFHRDEKGRFPAYNELAKDRGYVNEDMLGVIAELSKIPGIKRIRLSSLEPRLITEPFLEQLSQYDKICPHFHLSLQSGCNETLRRMNRHYTTDEYMESLSLLRRFYTHPAVTTDVIAGFPGETEDEFDTTCSFIKEAGFYDLHVFRYSERKNTVAAKLPGKVPDSIKADRSEKLIRLGEELSAEFRSYYIGKEVSVLFEEEKDGFFTGHTKEYVKTAKKGSETGDLSGRIVSGTVRFEKDGILFF